MSSSLAFEENVVMDGICGDIGIIRRVLRREVGRMWPFFLVKALVAGLKAFRKTCWAGKRTGEARFVRRMLVLPGIYVTLTGRLGRKKALEIMDAIMRSLGLNELVHQAESVGLGSMADGGQRMDAYRECMVEKHIGDFNEFDYVSQGQDRLHFRVSRCVFHTFFVEMGTPELTRTFCDIDRVFFERYFPEYEFHRNGSWCNTLGYGRDSCEYVIDREMFYNRVEDTTIEEPVCAIQ